MRCRVTFGVVRRLLWLVLVALLACDTPSEKVSVDLTTVRTGFTDEKPRVLQVEGPPNERSVVTDGTGFLDMTLRLPKDAELRYRAALGGLLRPMVQGADGQFVSLAVKQDADGSWRAPVPAGPDGPRDLRLLTVKKGPLWTEPEIVGRATPSAPVLPAGLRPRVAHPNVILYVVDTLRRDRLSLYGYHLATTPQLERLAERALVFDNAYSLGSFTSPSITGLFASRFPSELDARLATDGPAAQTLAEAFSDAGYQTAGFQANLLCITELGYGRGFDEYERLGSVDAAGSAAKLVDATTLHAAAVDWLRDRDPDQPFFLYLQSMDVHYPYSPPAPFADLFAAKDGPRATEEQIAQIRRLVPPENAKAVFEAIVAFSTERYDGAVAWVDQSLAQLFATLQRMGLAEDTIVVVTADHGEPLMDRGEMFHGQSVHEELVHVPLIMWLPGQQHGERVETVVSHLDLGPTLLDLAGVDRPERFLGRSWFAPGDGLAPPAAMGEQINAISHKAAGWFIREGPWKLIANRGSDGAPTYRLFHLPTDPGETQDVAKDNAQVARYLLGRATAREFIPPAAKRVAPLEDGLPEAVREERKKALRALGYLE